MADDSERKSHSEDLWPNIRGPRQSLESFDLDVAKAQPKTTASGFLSSLFRRVITARQPSKLDAVTPTASGASSPTPSDWSGEHESSPGGSWAAELDSTAAYSSTDVLSIPQPDAVLHELESSPMRLIRRLRGIGTSGINRDYWMRDEKVKDCYDCKQPFTTFRRKHHCRICGQIFCKKCASAIVPGTRFGHRGEMRVCNFCLKIMDDYRTDGGSNADSHALSVLSNTNASQMLFSTQILQQGRSPSISSPTQSRRHSFMHGTEYSEADGVKYANFLKRLDESSLSFRDDVPFRTNILRNGSIAEEPVDNVMPDDLEQPIFVAQGWAPSPFPDKLTAFATWRSSNEGNLNEELAESVDTPVRASVHSLPRKRGITTLSENLDQGSIVADESEQQIGLWSHPENSELNVASFEHMKRLVHQLLSKAGLRDEEAWAGTIIHMLLRVSHTIETDIRHGDSMNILNYVKIKCIPGGTIGDSEFVSGVVCSKKAIHKNMLKTVLKPRILIITFPFEYQRVENQFVSLETLIAQEHDHLRHLVDRVAVLLPDIVLVQRTVSRIAMDMLIEANIVVAYNVKLSVLERISRCTGADIIHSIDRLALLPVLGTCERFQFKAYVNSEISGCRKTFMWFEGCIPELGCSLVVRGGTYTELTKVKRLLKLLVTVAYNLRLETCLMRDMYAVTQSLKPEEDLTVQVTQGREESKITNAIKQFEHFILSSSPNVLFPLPYLLQKLRDSERNKPVRNTNSMAFNDLKSLKSGDDSNPKDLPYLEKVDLFAPIVDSTHMMVVSDAALDAENAFSLLDKITAFNQQHLMVLYSNFRNTRSLPCITPQAHLIMYYYDSDLSLGQFLEDLCERSRFPCPMKGCDSQMLQHCSVYAHHQGKITISMELTPSPIPGMEHHILMWSTCKKCEKTTPLVSMSKESWSYSFGKYLEVCFYHSKLTCRAMDCPHDVHRDHVSYFSLDDITIRFEYEEICLFDVSVPPMHQAPRTDVINKIRQQDMESIRKQIEDFYDSILRRANMFTIDIVPAARVQACKDSIVELTKRAASEKKFLLQLLQQTFITSAPDDRIALNTVFTKLVSKVAEWETEFNNFVRSFLQSEPREIRRMTTQIKRIFTERDTFGDAKGMSLAASHNNSPHFDLDLDLSTTHSKQIAFPKLLGSRSASVDLELGPTEVLEIQQVPEFNQIQRHFSLMYSRPIQHGRTTVSFPVLGGSPSRRASLILEDQNVMEEKHISILSPESDPEDDDPSPVNADVDFVGGDELLMDAEDSFMYPRQLPFNSSIGMTESPMADAKIIDTLPPKKRTSMGLILAQEEETPGNLNMISGVAAEVEQADGMMPISLTNPGERASIMKTISNLWTGNVANFLPLAYPLGPGEHVFPDSSIIVREDEPSSIIAFTLGSRHYRDMLSSMQSKTGETHPFIPPVHIDESSNVRYSIDCDDQLGDIEETLLKGTGTHIRYQFWDGNTRINCKVFFAEHFDALRRNCGAHEGFVQSLARCVKWDASGGKSGSSFLKTRDDWLVVKQLSRPEMDALFKFAPSYFEYMSQAFFHEVRVLCFGNLFFKLQFF